MQQKFCCALSLPARVSARPDAGKRFSAVTRQASETILRSITSTGGHLCTAGRTVCLMRHRRLAPAVPRRTTITYAQPAHSEL